MSEAPWVKAMNELRASFTDDDDRMLALWLGPCRHGRSPVTRCDDGCPEHVRYLRETERKP